MNAIDGFHEIRGRPIGTVVCALLAWRRVGRGMGHRVWLRNTCGLRSAVLLAPVLSPVVCQSWALFVPLHLLLGLHFEALGLNGVALGRKRSKRAAERGARTEPCSIRP